MTIYGHPKLGGTGRFPRGKLERSDRGELRLRVSAWRNGTVRLDFGTDVSWLGLDPASARDLAQSLLEMADAVEKDGAA